MSGGGVGDCFSGSGIERTGAEVKCLLGSPNALAVSRDQPNITLAEVKAMRRAATEL